VLFKALTQHNQAQKDKLCDLFPWMMELEQMSMMASVHHIVTFRFSLAGKNMCKKRHFDHPQLGLIWMCILRGLKVYLKLKKICLKKKVFISSKCT
jgi:hypothetical protein